MALGLGSLTETSINKLNTITSGASPSDIVSNKARSKANPILNSISDKFNSSLLSDKSKIKLPKDCLKGKSTGKGNSGKSGNKKKFNKLNCDPIVSKDTIKDSLGIKDKYNFLNKSDKKSMDDIVDKAFDELNSNVIPAKDKTILSNMKKHPCSIDTGLNLPSFDLPSVPGGSLLGGMGSTIGDALNTIGRGLGSALSAVAGCTDDIIHSTNSILATADTITDTYAKDGLIKGFTKSGKLDLSTSKKIESIAPSYSGLTKDITTTTPVGMLNVSNSLSHDETNDLLDTVMKSNSIYDIKSNNTILETALADSRINTNIGNNTVSSSQKLSVLSKLKNSKMKLVA
jgi:hypothetical protein